MPSTKSPVGSARLAFWFDFGSTYSYLSMMRIEKLAREAGVRILWRPFLLGPIFKELGWNSSPFLEQKEKLAYMWVDMRRQAARYGIPWRQPSEFPRNGVLPLRVACAHADAPWIGEFCRAVMVKNFAEDADIHGEAAVGQILDRLGLPAAGILSLALSEANKAALRAQTQRARDLGIFGGPTFFAGEEMFWGNDRLEDALACAAAGPDRQ